MAADKNSFELWVSGEKGKKPAEQKIQQDKTRRLQLFREQFPEFYKGMEQQHNQIRILKQELIEAEEKLKKYDTLEKKLTDYENLKKKFEDLEIKYLNLKQESMDNLEAKAESAAWEQEYQEIKSKYDRLKPEYDELNQKYEAQQKTIEKMVKTMKENGQIIELPKNP